MAWLYAFLFTQAVEIPIYIHGLRARPHEAFSASLLTHPIVWFVIPPAFEGFYLSFLAPHPFLWMSSGPRYWAMVLVAETFAVLVEAAYFKALKKSRPLRWAFIANLSSVSLGLVSRELFGWP